MEDAEDAITLEEALETQEMLESQSEAVLGASDPQNCSYSKGYMKRQALYACLTCNPKGAPFAQPAGVCLACSYKCHDGHEMVELFTKRHFRCDCGNKKFSDNPCKLHAEKEDFNTENVYSQNFDGLYCACHRPYPDPDTDNDVADDSMIQCAICEDWFHFQHCLAHLNTDFETLETENMELICGPCMGRLDFLGHYAHFQVVPAKKEEEKELIVTPSESEKVSLPVPTSEESNLSAPKSEDEQAKDLLVDTNTQDSGIDSLQGPEGSLDSDVTEKCMLKIHAKGQLQISERQGVAWKGTLRSALCRCSDCMEMYEKLKIKFLLDEEDTIEHYEALGKKYTEAAKLSAEASINDQVNQLGRVGQIEFLHGYNQFKEQLADFLKGHAESGKVVNREDVTNFFEKVREEQAAKRRRLE